ncbi:MAG: hypothetical protein H0V70_05740 [Ktedonobacteraceae bacterium]|nr:hypothetical protein [Ktedonobacteraceae bacterium]
MKILWQLDIVRYEIRVTGILLFAIPLLFAAGLAVLAEFLQIGHVSQPFINDVLLAGLEACLPLTSGIIAATVATQDPAIELQLTLPLPYRSTTFLRLALLLIWTALIALLSTLALHLALPSVLPTSLAEEQLIWSAPLLWFTAVGTILALLMRNRSTSSAILGCLWVMQLVFHGYFLATVWTRPWFLFTTLYAPDISFWLANRIELILTSVIVFIATWFYLRNSEWRFFGEEDK